MTGPDPTDAEATLVDAEQAARLAHVPIGTFWRWVHEHRIQPQPVTTDDGRQLYLEADVLDAELATRRAPRLRRLTETARQQAATPTT